MRLLCLLTVTLLAGGASAGEKGSPPEGFTPLFNGRNLDGWKATGDPKVWTAEDGMIVVKGGGGGWLMTEKEYGNFELYLEYRLPRGGNSGVAIRSPLEGDPAYKGMELQLIDDLHWPGKLESWQHTGSIYNVVPAAKIVSKEPGEWNTMHVTARGRHVKVEHNGTTIVDADLDDYVKEHAQRHPGILRETGHIGMQSYNLRVEFRNLGVKPLE